MRTEYDAIYISPHLDDVALSCGGQIYLKTAVDQTILIITVAAGDPPVDTFSDFAKHLHARWQLGADAIAQRRIEDHNACQILGADYWHWQLPDCIYRHHPQTGQPLYASGNDIFGNVHQAEKNNLVNKLAQQFAESLPKHKALYIPLTVGNHVDHQLTQLALLQTVAEGWPATIYFYEDYPYVQKENALEPVLAHYPVTWQSKTISLSPTALQAKMDSIAAFTSQMDSLFGSEDNMRQRVQQYVQTVGGERLWYQ